jgi:hypothetical protein
MSVPSYGAYPVRTPNGTVVGYVHHDHGREQRYRAVSRTASDVPLRRRGFSSHDDAAVALMCHHYTHASCR